MMIASKLKGLGDNLIGIAVFGFILFIGIWLIKGMVWVGDYAYPVIQQITNLALFIAFFICLPLLTFKKFRIYCLFGFLIAAYISGLDLWVNSLITTYVIWGWVGVAIGLLFGGIGIIPVALLATLVNGQWNHFGAGVFSLLITIGLFALSIWIVTKADSEKSSSQ